MTQLIIGITGRKGCGKSTLASMLKAEIPNAHIVAFADALKDDVADMIGNLDHIVPPIGRAWLDAHKGTIFGPVLQGYGELMRVALGQDYWVDALADTLLDYDRDAIIIIPDVRYENEAAFVHANGGLLVAIDGPSRWEGDQRDASHPSEANVDKVRQVADIVVNNENDIFSLLGEAFFIAKRAQAVPA